MSYYWNSCPPQNQYEKVVKELDLQASRGREPLLEYLRSDAYDKVYFSNAPVMKNIF